MRALVADWRAAGTDPESTRAVLLQTGARQTGGSIAIGIFEPALEADVGDMIGIILLSADEAAQLLDRLMHGLDQIGASKKVDRKLSARERALTEP